MRYFLKAPRGKLLCALHSSCRPRLGSTRMLMLLGSGWFWDPWSIPLLTKPMEAENASNFWKQQNA